MTRSELIEALAEKQMHLSKTDVEMAVKTLIAQMSESLANGDRIEIRGFGSFSLHRRNARDGHNPRTGAKVHVAAKYAPHFKPGKELKEKVNRSAKTTPGV